MKSLLLIGFLFLVYVATTAFGGGDEVNFDHIVNLFLFFVIL
jgi:hypothetical protein